MFIFSAVICMLIGIPFMKDFTPFYPLVLSLCFGLIGFLDDFFKIKYKRNLGLTSLQKAMLQMAVSALYLYLLYKQGSLTTNLYIPFVEKPVQIHILIYIFFAMFVMVGCVNAVNLTDGIDGLCSSVTAVIAIFFSLVFLREGNGAATFSLALAGGLVGFFLYNKNPARTFMGDTGSLFLGGAVCAMAFAYDMPLILVPIGLVYIVETLSVIIQVGYFKITHGKRFFKMAPIHHHLELCGWSEWKIVIVACTVTAALCALSLLA